jgi:hypothetical protein
MAFNRGPKIVTNGLVLALDAASQNSYPESGTVWTDLSGNSNTFELYNAASYSTNGNGSISFNGTTSGVSGSNASVYSITGTITLEVWTYLTTSGNFFIIGKGPSNNVGNQYPGNYELQTQTSNVFRFMHQTTTTNANASFAYYDTPTNVYTNNRWTHAVAVCNGSTATIYVNGVAYAATRNLAGTNGGLVSTNTQTLKIARRTDGAVMAGNIASVKIYNRLLSASEITQNYNATKSRFNL